jgi:hypothetical protein
MRRVTLTLHAVHMLRMLHAIHIGGRPLLARLARAPRKDVPAARSRPRRLEPAPEDAVWPTLRNYPYAA